jgi:hypothetical protein
MVFGGQAAMLFACTESRCRDSRNVLADTPAFGLCEEDVIEFSPSNLVFDLSGNIGDDETVPSSDAGAGVNLSEATVAVLARSPEGIPRSLAEIDVFECGEDSRATSGRVVNLEAVGAACRPIGGSRLRCITDSRGVFEFRATPSGSNSVEGDVCASVSPAASAGSKVAKPVERMRVKTIGNGSADLQLEAPEGDVTLGPASFALNCPSNPVCLPASTLRALPIRPVLRGDCTGDGGCAPTLAKNPVIVDVAVEALTTNNARFGLSPEPTCLSRHATVAGVVSEGESQLNGVYFCSDGTPGTYRVVSKLRGAAGVAEQTVTVDPDPIVVSLDGVTAVPSPAADGGEPSRTATVAFSYRLCGSASLAEPSSADFWSRTSGGATLRLSSVDLATDAAIGLSAVQHPSTANVTLLGENPSLAVNVFLDGPQVVPPLTCTWNFDVVEAP